MDFPELDVDFEVLDWIESSNYFETVLNGPEPKGTEDNTKGNAEEKEKCFRFAQPLSKQEVESRVKDSVPRATLYKNGWTVKLFETWRNERNIRAFDNKMEKALEELSDEELVEYLPLFIAEVRKTDGTKYPPRSLHGIISSMQNHLRLQGREVNLFSDERFRLLRGSLDAAMKHSASEGLGATIK